MKNNRLLYILIAILLIWCISLTAILSNSYEKKNEIVNEYTIDGFSTDFTKIVDEKISSVVSINTNGTISTGFIYSQDDESVYVVTSYHGIGSNSQCIVYLKSGYKTNAEVIGYNVYADLAVLKMNIPFDVQPLIMADSDKTSPGEFAICIGTPISLDYAGSVELGMVANNIITIENNITVNNENIIYFVDVLELSSNLKPGFSGSPILNMGGEVIGVTTMSLTDGYNFAITANETKIIVDKIIANEDTKKYQLGLKGTYIKNMPLYERTNLNLPVDVAYGLYINKLMDNSFAFNADLRVDDVLLSINDKKLNNINDYLSIVYADVDSFNFEVFRNGEIINLKANIND